MTKPKIKAASISNLTDARYFAAWGVDYIGLNLYSSPGFSLSKEQIAGIIEWVEGPVIVGEFGMIPAEDILEAIEAYKLQAIQVEMFFPSAELARFKHIFLIQELVLSNPEDFSSVEPLLIQNSPYVDTFILNFEKNGITWKQLEAHHEELLRQIRSLSDSVSFLLQVAFDPKDVASLILKTGAEGFCLSGGEEEKVGYKSFEELDLIFEELENQLD